MNESFSLKSREQHLTTLATVLRVEREIGLPEGALRLEGGWEGLLAALAHFNPRTVFVCRYALEEEDFLLNSSDAGMELLELGPPLDTLYRPLKAFRKYIGELLHLEVLFHGEGERLST